MALIKAERFASDLLIVNFVYICPIEQSFLLNNDHVRSVSLDSCCYKTEQSRGRETVSSFESMDVEVNHLRTVSHVLSLSLRFLWLEA